MFDPYNPDPYEWPYWPIVPDPAIRQQRPDSPSSPAEQRSLFGPGSTQESPNT
jgi:hypothetical protein